MRAERRSAHQWHLLPSLACTFLKRLIVAPCSRGETDNDVAGRFQAFCPAADGEDPLTSHSSQNSKCRDEGPSKL